MNKELENRDVGSDLCKLASLLVKYNICNDIAPLQNAGSACISTATSKYWFYILKKISFIADDVNGRLCSDSTDINISLSVTIEGHHSEGDSISNPLNKLLFDIEIDGVRLNPGTYVIDNLYAAWHLDKHIIEPSDGKSKYSHPLYHLTFGGVNMKAKGHDIYGNALIMPSPRLTYPPMDAVLGIDFILQNYLNRDRIEKLIQDPKYIVIVKKSQSRIWKPFFCSLYSHWNNQSHTVAPDFIPSKLLPLYY